MDEWRTALLGELTIEVRDRAGSETNGLTVFGVDRASGLTEVAKYQSEDLSRYKRVSPGSFVYNPMRLNIGSIGYCRPGQKPGLASPDYVVFECDRRKLDPDYLAYVVLSPVWKTWTSARGTGSVRLRIYFRELSELRLSLPPLEEQRAIAGVLGALDDKIDLNRRMNETLDALARHLHCDASRDAEWRRLGDVVDVNSRKRRRDFEFDEIEYVDISSVKEGVLDALARTPVSEAPSRAQRLVVDGDTIWSCVRPNRKSYAFMAQPPQDRVVSTGFAVLSPRAVPPAFLYLAVTTGDFVDYLSANADGSAYPAVRADHFEEAEIRVPPEEVLDSIEKRARPLLDRIAYNERETRTLAELRDALLPKLISGELRVRDAADAGQSSLH